MSTTPAAPDAYDEALARHYDEDYEILRRDAGDVRFYRELALASGGPVLEVACGTGRVLLPVATAGLDCTGVDPSPTMLEVLETKRRALPADVAARVRGLAGSYQALPVDGPYALVYSAFRAFQHLHGRDQKVAGLREMARVLAPGGTLAFDLFDYNPAYAEDAPVEKEDYRLQDGDVIKARYSLAERAADESHIAGRFRWTVDGEETDRASFRMDITRRDELDGLLAEAGLELAQLLGDFDGSPWVPERPRELIVLARRVEGDAAGEARPAP